MLIYSARAGMIRPEVVSPRRVGRVTMSSALPLADNHGGWVVQEFRGVSFGWVNKSPVVSSKPVAVQIKEEYESKFAGEFRVYEVLTGG
jgi:hypothetical protein